jgi:cell division protein FtsL
MTDLPEEIQKQLLRLQAYDDEISKEMPPDFKDWWENSKDEWPLITRLVLEARRGQIDDLYSIIDKQAQEIEDLGQEINYLRYGDD